METRKQPQPEPNLHTSIRGGPIPQCGEPTPHFRNGAEKQEPFARTPDSVLFRKGLSLAAKAVYGALARHAFRDGRITLGQRRLGELLDVDHKTIGHHLERLRDANLIEVKQLGNGRASYRLLSGIFRSNNSKSNEMAESVAVEPKKTCVRCAKEYKRLRKSGLCFKCADALDQIRQARGAMRRTGSTDPNELAKLLAHERDLEKWLPAIQKAANDQ